VKIVHADFDAVPIIREDQSHPEPEIWWLML